MKKRWLVGGLMFLCGCGDESSRPASLSQAELASEMAKSFCQSRVGCCEAQGFDIELDTCLSEGEAAFAEAYAFDPDKTDYDGEAAADCIAKADAWMRCGTEVDGKTPPSCDRILLGKLPPGSPCEESFECAPGTARGSRGICDIEPGSDEQTCRQTRGDAAAVRGKRGDACLATCGSGDCSEGLESSSAEVVLCYEEDGLFCAEHGTCENLGEVGDSCGQCRAPAFCDFESGKCQLQRRTANAVTTTCSARAAAAKAESAAIPRSAKRCARPLRNSAAHAASRTIAKRALTASALRGHGARDRKRGDRASCGSVLDRGVSTVSARDTPHQ